MKALLLLGSLAVSAPAATLPDPCQPPFGSVTDCPDKYMPHPIQTPPSTTDKAAIQTLINAGTASLLTERAKRVVWATAKVAVEGLGDMTSAEAGAAIAAYEKAAGELRDAKLATQKAYDKAIIETVRIYRLTPPVSDFSQDQHIREQLRSRRSWAPRFSQEEILDKKTGAMRQRTPQERKALDTELYNQAQALGMTNRPQPAAANTEHATGQIRVFQDSFQNPDILAALIYHETTHWVDFMANGGKVRSPGEKYRLEARAYARQAQLYASLGLVVEARNATGIATQYLKQEAEAKSKHLTFDHLVVDPVYSRWLQGSTPADPVVTDHPETGVTGEDRFLEDLERMRGVSDEARATARRRNEIEQAEREERQKLDHVALMRRIAAEEELWRAAYRYIKTAAGLACADPRAFASQAQGGAVVSASVDELAFSSYLSQDINEVGWKSIGVKPNDCQREVMNKIIYSRAPVGPSDIAGWALAYRNAHPTLLKRFATSVGEFFETKGSYEAERGRADSSPNQRSDAEGRRESEEPRSESRPEPRNGYREGEAVRQARGIDATKVWVN